MATPSEMPAAAIVPPLGLAAYQDGAVVSRTLLKRAGGTISLFRVRRKPVIERAHGAV